MYPVGSHILQTTTYNPNPLPSMESFLPRDINELPVAHDVNQSLEEDDSHLSNPDERPSIAHDIHAPNNQPISFGQNPANGAGYGHILMASHSEHQGDNQKAIKIKCEPRPTHHPRTLKEKDRARDIILAAEGSLAKYPSIYLFARWREESTSNIIEVTLVDRRGNLHPYSIEYVDNPAPIDIGYSHHPHALYFDLTDDDFHDFSKSFRIAIIKSKQDTEITKKRIEEDELYKSSLCFKRYYRDKEGIYQPEEESTAYTCIMIEKYGDISVKYVTPQYGPMEGGHLLDIALKGFTAPALQKLSVKIRAEAHGWECDMPSFDSTGGTVHYKMPACPSSHLGSVLAEIVIFHEGQQIDTTSYLYLASLDPILAMFGISKLLPIRASNTAASDVDQDLTTPSVSSTSTSKKSSNKRQRKS